MRNTHSSGKRERTIIEIGTYDTQEMIDICLECDLPRCIQNCPKMLKAKGKSRDERNGKPGVLYPYKGGPITLAEAERLSGIPRKSLKYRMQTYGMSVEQAIAKGMPHTRKRKEKIK